jgi:hypothetical protein
VGNDVYSAFTSSHLAQVSRLVHARDIVPHLPPRALGFQHEAQEIYYPQDGPGSYTTCTGGPVPAGSEDPNCSDGITLPLSISDHNLYIGQPVSGC